MRERGEDFSNSGRLLITVNYYIYISCYCYTTRVDLSCVSVLVCYFLRFIFASLAADQVTFVEQ